MNIPEKLAEAVAGQDWRLVSDVHESLTGLALELPENRDIGSEIMRGLEDFLDSLKRGEVPKGTLVFRETEETIVDMTKPKKNKKKTKRKNKTTQNMTTIDENSSDPVIDDVDLYEPERTGNYIEAKRAGTVQVDKTKTELITCEADEKEYEQNKKKSIPRKPRKAYKELKYECYKCNREQKSSRRLLGEDIKNFVCDECGRGVIRRS